MPKVKLYNTQGKVVGEQELLDSVFGVPVKKTVVHEVVTSIQANARHPWAHTKTKGEVRGTGTKPWKQKGTGRARQGSHRNPQWAGGGIVFGPRSDRDYSKKINRKTKIAALRMTLSDKVSADRLVLIEEFPSAGKTKASVGIISSLPAKGRVSVIVDKADSLILRSLRNVEDVRVANAASLGIMDIIGADAVVMTVAAAKSLEKAAVGTKA